MQITKSIINYILFINSVLTIASENPQDTMGLYEVQTYNCN